MIEIKNVTKKYGNKVALDDISFNVEDGEIFAFIGHNGAGKTTLIKSMVGIHDFDLGDIIINGKSIKNNDIACESCAENYPNTPNKDLLYNKCISSCQTGYLYSDNHQCYQDCEDLILLPLFYENKKCVYECSKGYARDNENSKNCHSCKSIVNGICVACSGYSCFYDDINEQDCSTYHCLNEGTCYMKNREPVCLCVGDYLYVSV